ncbi:MAG: EAL domain-containing protein [Thiocapsa sp.]|nr:EAL domain-containing protein [Thiocapsa sp.]MCG6985113.1 EAL domain-containing protein [Thiocapsa sp.]
MSAENPRRSFVPLIISTLVLLTSALGAVLIARYSGQQRLNPPSPQAIDATAAQSEALPTAAEVAAALELPAANQALIVGPTGGWGDPVSLALMGGLGLGLSLLLAILVKRLLDARAAQQRLEAQLDEQVADAREQEAERHREHQLLRQAEQLATLGSWEWDIANDRFSFSAAWLAIHGVQDQPPVSLADTRLLAHPDDSDALEEAFTAAREGSRDLDIEHRIIRRSDGSLRQIHTLGLLIRDAHGAPRSLYGLSQDVTDQTAAETELRILAIAFEAQEGMVVTDAQQRILRVNSAFTRTTGYSPEEALGQTLRLLESGHHDQAFFSAMWERIRTFGFWEGEIWNRRKNGEIYPDWMTISSVKDTRGRVTHYVATLTDITHRKTVEEIRHLAFYDPLTNLPNRRLVLDRLRQALAASGRTGQEGALLFVDLDNFKLLNDTRGHEVGDLLLQQVAERLLTCVRESDSVARLGGDEFLVMLPELGPDHEQAAALATTVGNKILDTLGAPYRLGGHDYQSTPSVGIALFGRQPKSADDVLRQADVAMYQAKAAGRNTLRFFDPEMQQALHRRATLEADLRRAVNEGQFLLYYQPQVNQRGHITGAEALLRWHHPERGIILPGQFIGLAEAIGLTRPLGRWVLSQACAQLAEWAARPETAGLRLAVNISPGHFRHPDFVEDVRAALAGGKADPCRLRLELTESPLLDDPGDTLTKMTALKANGVGFTLDNFGIGYCSLSYLKRLPLDQLKLAPSFVREVLADPKDDAIADHFVALAEGMGLAIMAEGVETEAQRNYLLSHGCNIFQGFLFGRPGPAADFADAARSHHAQAQDLQDAAHQAVAG